MIVPLERFALEVIAVSLILKTLLKNYPLINVTSFYHMLKHLILILDVNKTCDGRPSTDWQCCTSQSPCGIGEGDCDTDSDCRGLLKCGKNNCIKSGNHWNSSADCCEGKTTCGLILYILI